MIIAHRGVFHNPTVPENSLPAFQKAIDEKIPFELDVQLTKDDVIVIFHDKNLKRMTGIDKKLVDCTYDELKNYYLFDTKEKIPTLEEVLLLNHDQVFMDIEIKSPKNISETCECVCSLLKDYYNYSLKSFNPKVCRYLKKHYPSLNVGYLISDIYPKKIYSILLPTHFMIHYSKADFLSIRKNLFSKKKYQKLKKKYPISLWTIKEKEEVLDDNLCYICNNLPYRKKK